jgi:hypothetical protein
MIVLVSVFANSTHRGSGPSRSVVTWNSNRKAIRRPKACRRLWTAFLGPFGDQRMDVLEVFVRTPTRIGLSVPWTPRRPTATRRSQLRRRPRARCYLGYGIPATWKG